MATITTKFLQGGSGLTPGSSAGSPDLTTALRDVADDLTALAGVSIAAVQTAAADISAVSAADITAVSAADIAATTQADVSAVATPAVSATAGVVNGLVVGAPTTPSSQAVDPGGFTDWNVNISAGYVFANSVGGYFTAQTDFNVSTGSKIMDIGQAMYAWIVAAEAGGALTQVAVLGTAAALGAETIPTDGNITTGVGHANWTKLALCHASRTADAVVATTENPSLMTPWGGAGTTLINELRTRAGECRALVNELKTIAGTVRTLANELKTRQGEDRTLANELKTRQGEDRTLANDLKTKFNGMVASVDAVVLKTIKG